jgi:hypothetical protein
VTKLSGLKAAQISASLREAKKDCEGLYARKGFPYIAACVNGAGLVEKNMKDRSPFLSAAVRCPPGEKYDRHRKACVPACPPGQIFDPVMEVCVPRINGVSGLTITNVGIAADRARADCQKQGRHLACVRAVGVVEASLKTLHPITRDLVRQSARGAAALCLGPDAADCRRGVRLMIIKLKALKPGLDGQRSRA